MYNNTLDLAEREIVFAKKKKNSLQSNLVNNPQFPELKNKLVFVSMKKKIIFVCIQDLKTYSSTDNHYEITNRINFSKY